MKKYSARPAVPNDIDAVYELIAKQDLADYGSSMMTPGDLQKRNTGS